MSANFGVYPSKLFSLAATLDLLLPCKKVASSCSGQPIAKAGFALTLLLTLLMVTSVKAQLLGGANLPVIRVAKVEFTQGRVDSLARMLAMQQFQGKQVPPDAVSQIRFAVVDNLIGQELLRLEAERQKLNASPKMVDSVFQMFKGQFPSEQVFQSELKKSGSTEKEFRQKIKRQLEADMLLEKQIPYPKEPTDREISEYFEKHKDGVVISDTISGAQIYLKLGKNESPQAIADKRSILEGLSAQVRAGRASFAQLAAQHSDDPEAEKTGGVLRKVVPKDFGPEFAKAVANLKVGDISPVFQTKLGLHIVMLTEKNDGKLDSYKHRIDYLMRMDRERDRQMAIKAYLDTLAKQFPVVYLNPEYMPPQPIGGSRSGGK